jgi:hypothetical protein
MILRMTKTTGLLPYFYLTYHKGAVLFVQRSYLSLLLLTFVKVSFILAN